MEKVLISLPSNLYKKYPSIKNLRVCEFINYGYVKKRDYHKWVNDEIVAVKCGQLSAASISYKDMSVEESVKRRIDEQDTTSCFEDGDELIPVYYFVSKDSDKEWREYLKSKGFKESRTSKKREGIYISKKELFSCYSTKYKIKVDGCEEVYEKIKEKELNEKKIQESIIIKNKLLNNLLDGKNKTIKGNKLYNYEIKECLTEDFKTILILWPIMLFSIIISIVFDACIGLTYILFMAASFWLLCYLVPDGFVRKEYKTIYYYIRDLTNEEISILENKP